MKITELLTEASIDPNKNIEKLLSRYFSIRSNKNPSYTINNGVVNVNGDIRLVDVKLYKLITSKLPITFGEIYGNFDVSNAEYTTLKGCPKYVGSNFRCLDNKLINLKGGPEEVNGNYFCWKNPLTTFDGIAEDINGILYAPYDSNLPLLKLLSINGLKRIQFDNFTGSDEHIMNTVENILNKYLDKGKGGILACAAELTKAGFKGNARL